LADRGEGVRSKDLNTSSRAVQPAGWIRSLADRRRVWLMALPALIFLLLAAGSLGPSSYFLHFDTSTQSVAAADLIHGCWGYDGNKPGIMLILGAAFALGGIRPLWEMVLLSLLGAVGAAAFFRLAARLSGSQRWAMLGAIWFLGLPIYLYHMRMHIGYPLFFFTLGLALHAERRFGLAGAALGLTLLTHPIFAVPVAAWLGWSFVLHGKRERVRAFVKLGAGMLAPILVVEVARFLFTGEPLGWSRGVIVNEVLVKAGVQKGQTLATLWQRVLRSNGGLNLALLLSGLAYPLLRRRGERLMDAVYLTGWSVVGFYVLRVGVGHRLVFERMLAGVYPPLALSTIVTLTRLAERVGSSLAPPVRAACRLVVAGVIALGLPALTLDNVLDRAVASRTAYDVIDRTVAEAAEAGMPVRFFGNYHVGLFYAVRHDVETGVNERALDVIAGDTRAVLIFEGKTGREHPTLTALRDYPIDASLYTISSYTHRPALWSQRRDEASWTEVEIWWPRSPEGTFEAEENLSKSIFHYRGGCTLPKPYGSDHTLNYYDLLLDKGRQVWVALAEGDYARVKHLIVTWLKE
jgi:hypothetical protein